MFPNFESLAKRLDTHYDGVSNKVGFPKRHRDIGVIYEGPGTIIELSVTDDQSISPNSWGGSGFKLCLQFFYFRVPSNPESLLIAIFVAVATPPKLEILAAWPVARLWREQLGVVLVLPRSDWHFFLEVSRPKMSATSGRHGIGATASLRNE